MDKQELILAVETSGRTGSVALAMGKQLAAQSVFSAPMKHSAEIFPAISNLLKEFGHSPADITTVCISAGPGSFTGLRIAVTLAKMLYLAQKVKIVAVDTLDVVAQNAIDLASEYNIERVAAVLDAKRGQFFTAAFEKKGNQWEKFLPDDLLKPAELLKRTSHPKKQLWLTGEGLVYHKAKFEAPGVSLLPKEHWAPTAANVHKIGWHMIQQDQYADPLKLTPAYLRRPEAEENWEKRHGE